MGMFGSRKKTYVSSVVYNMAGDENERPNYLKTTVVGSVMNASPHLGQDIYNSYLNGPGIRFRNFARWARTSGYTQIVGQVSGSLLTGNSVDLNVLRDQIPHAVGETVLIQSNEIGDADYTWWADRWMADNHPAQLNDAWTADIEGQTINILFNDVVTYTFVAADFDLYGRYLYVGYNLSSGDQVQPLVPGSKVVLAPADPWPDTTGWTAGGNSVVNTDVVLNNKVVTDVTYSDGRPAEHNEVTTPRTETYQEIHRDFNKTEFLGNKPGTDATYSVTSTMYQDQIRDVSSETTETTNTEDIGGGVTKTTVTKTTVETLGIERSYRVDTQETLRNSWSNMKVFIYKYGSGNAILDAMFAPSTGNQDFFPFIPFRINNNFVSETHYSELYGPSKKALKKSTTGKFDEIIDNIADNDSLKDIDYAYAVFGVSLNVKEVACREYIYRFFQAILNGQSSTGTGDYTAWKLEWNAADASVKAWNNWKTAQGDSSNPLFGTPEPVKKAYPPQPSGEIKIKSDKNQAMNYSMAIRWNSIEETEYVGVGRPDAKQGDLWFGLNPDELFLEEGYINGVWDFLNTVNSNNIDLTWQDSPTTYRRLRIRGLIHRNEIYKGKAVEIDGRDALEDAEESGFIIPLHEGIYRSMPLTKSTQMATACSFIVFNCYKTVKKKWYQTGLFKVVLIIVIIVITIFFPPGGAAAGGGLLGSGAAVGAALGLSGMAAIIVGAIANAIAAMLLVAIIQRGAIALFGDKLGTIIGAIAAVVALNVGSAMANGQSMAQGFGNMMRADNLIQLTSAGLDAYSNYINISTQGILEETNKLIESYKVESQQISQAYAETFGVNKGVIDPFSLTDSARSYGFTPESAASFLERTLLVGSDIADMSLEMLSNFADLTVNTNLQT